MITQETLKKEPILASDWKYVKIYEYKYIYIYIYIQEYMHIYTGIYAYILYIVSISNKQKKTLQLVLFLKDKSAWKTLDFP